MPAYILRCLDRPDAGALRADTRERHLEYIAAAGDLVLLAGPTLGDDGAPIGSMLIIEAADKTAASEFAAKDPYAVAGLFSNTEIQAYRIVTGALTT
ncbi:MAG: YciI family protein [Marinicaulis sp.]|nr:YciI family protein [Marinicaulis sp.]